MIARNIKKLLLDKLKETGDDPENVKCTYFIRIRPPYFPGTPVQLMHKCLATGLPECDFSSLSGDSEKYVYRLVRKRKVSEIKISVRKAWQNERD